MTTQQIYKNVEAWTEIRNQMENLFSTGQIQTTDYPERDLHNLFTLINEIVTKYFENYQMTEKDEHEKQMKSKKKYLESKAKDFMKYKHVTPECSFEELFEFFKGQFTKKHSDPVEYIDWDVDLKKHFNFDMDTITKDELISILNVSNSDSKDEYGVSYNILKNLNSNIIYDYICDRYSKVIVQMELSEKWVTGIIEAKYKKGSPKVASNFRPLIKHPMYIRMYNRILSRRLYSYLKKNWMLDTDIQKGLDGAYNGVYEHVMTVRNIMEHAEKNNESVVVTFLDVKDAYGSISYAFIDYMMKYYQIPEKVADYICFFFMLGKAELRMGDQKSEMIELQIGLHQGCSLSNVLYLMAMNIFLVQIKKMYPKEGYNISNDVNVMLLAYVDDNVLITRNKKAAKLIGNTLATMLKKNNTFFNYSKIKYLAINSENDKEELIIDNHEIQDIGDERFYYLGSMLNPSIDLEFSLYLEDYVGTLARLDMMDISDNMKILIYKRYITRKFVWDMQLVLWYADRKNTIKEQETPFLQKWKFGSINDYLTKRDEKIDEGFVKHSIGNKAESLKEFSKRILGKFVPNKVKEMIQKISGKESNSNKNWVEYAKVLI